MPDLVDPVALWQSLPQDSKDRLGALAIAAQLAMQGTTTETMDLSRLIFYENTLDECDAEITDLVAGNLAEAFDEDCDPLRPDLNKLGIRQCTICGCTESHGCSPACTWTGPTTCSGCTAPEAA